MEDIASTVQVPTADSSTKEKPDEVMIYIDNASESLHVEDEKEVIDSMEIDYIDERWYKSIKFTIIFNKHWAIDFTIPPWLLPCCSDHSKSGFYFTKKIS